MRNLLLAVCLLGFSVSAMASCEQLKAKIDAKLQAKGVKSYTLDIVPVAQVAEPAAASGATTTPAQKPAGKVVGSCEGDTKQIIYKRN
jgi:Protein of unknown function (DUF1161)